MEELWVHDEIKATLKNGQKISGEVFKVEKNGFYIDDNITGDIFLVLNSEVEEIEID